MCQFSNWILTSILILFLRFWFSFLHGFSDYILSGVVPLFITRIDDLINKISLPFALRTKANCRTLLNLVFSTLFFVHEFVIVLGNSDRGSEPLGDESHISVLNLSHERIS